MIIIIIVIIVISLQDNEPTGGHAHEPERRLQLQIAEPLELGSAPGSSIRELDPRPKNMLAQWTLASVIPPLFIGARLASLVSRGRAWARGAALMREIGRQKEGICYYLYSAT